MKRIEKSGSTEPLEADLAPPLREARGAEIAETYLRTHKVEHIYPGGGQDYRKPKIGEMFDGIVMWQRDLRRHDETSGNSFASTHIAAIAVHLLEIAVHKHPQPVYRKEWPAAVGTIRLAEAFASDLGNDNRVHSGFGCTAAFYGDMLHALEGDGGFPWFAASIGLLMIELAEKRVTVSPNEALSGSHGIDDTSIARLAEVTLAALGVPVADTRMREMGRTSRAA